MEKRRLTRRDFLGLSAAAGTSAILAACAPEVVEKTVKETVEVEVEKVVTEVVEVETEVEVEKEVVVTATAEPMPEAAVPTDMEAPMLADMVAAGDLPPLDERLPVEPLVVKTGTLVTADELPEVSLGWYGGDLRMVHVGGFCGYIFLGSIEPLVACPSFDISQSFGGVAKDFSYDGSTYTFTLREGMKWSDGAPVTTEDVKFTFEDLYWNEEWPGGLPGDFKSATGADAVLDIVDDYTFKLTFDVPYGGFVGYLAIASWNSYQPIIKPAHYLKDFHPDYADAGELATMLDDAGYAEGEWYRLMADKDVPRWSNQAPQAAGFPTLAPWMFIEELADGTRICERNPYYWKVDTAGRQLPYVDRLVSRRAETSQAMQTLVLGGEADLGGEDNKLAFAYAQMAEESGTHRVHLLAFHINSVLLFQPSNDDPIVGPVLQDIRFRQAVAKAINYDEMATSVLFKLASTPNWGYSATVPATGDMEGAKALLDEMGMDQLDDEGMRLTPAGEKFTFVLETHQATQAWLNPSAELIAAQLRDVGIRADTLIDLDPAIVEQHAAENTLMARIQWMHGPLWNTGIFNDWAGGNWATPWFNWADATVLGNEIPEGAIEPPDDYKRLLEIREEFKVYNFDAPEVPALYDEVMSIHTDNVWIIPLSSDDKVPVLTNAKLGNVCDGCQAIVYDFAIEQLYFEE